MTLRRHTIAAASLAGALALGIGSTMTMGRPATPNGPFPEPPQQATPHGQQVAIFAGGCFWGIEGVFDHVRGVRSVTAGYAGGTRETATYRDVSSERTGHAEAVRVVYDPAKISYGQLLKVFFSVAHDPTEVGGQFPDRGSSYRSAIFPQNAAQRAIAQSYIARINAAHVYARPLSTTLETGRFYPAESWHQDYLRNHPNDSYIVRYDKPKIAALRKAWPALYRS